MDAEVRDLLERGVVALEKLNEEPVIHMETGPPACPHCGRVNPRIRTEESEAEGIMAECVFRFMCCHCNSVFYAVPLQWAGARTIEEAAQVISERAEIGGFNS